MTLCTTAPVRLGLAYLPSPSPRSLAAAETRCIATQLVVPPLALRGEHECRHAAPRPFPPPSPQNQRIFLRTIEESGKADNGSSGHFKSIRVSSQAVRSGRYSELSRRDDDEVRRASSGGIGKSAGDECNSLLLGATPETAAAMAKTRPSGRGNVWEQ